MHLLPLFSSILFFFNDTATTEIYTLSLHDALPISRPRLAKASQKRWAASSRACRSAGCATRRRSAGTAERHARELAAQRSEEHTSELQSLAYLVCRLLLEKKKK